MTGVSAASWILDHAPYTPFMASRTARPPGLMPLDPTAWIVTDPDHAAQMAYRRELMARLPEVVFGLLPEGVAPAAELAELVLDVAGMGWRSSEIQPPSLNATGCDRPEVGASRPPEEAGRARSGTNAPGTETPRVTRIGNGSRFDALVQIGHAVADDFCLLMPDAASGEYRLVAAVLCFPSRWLLSEKLGHPLTHIHVPVPDYDATLARRVNRVFETLRVDRPLYRINWLVHPTPELHLPMGLSDKLMAAAEGSGGLYLRTERQTLTRLPGTGGVAFGIKTSITPLDCLTPAQAGALARELRTHDEAVVEYRSGRRVLRSALDVLDRIADGAG